MSWLMLHDLTQVLVSCSVVRRLLIALLQRRTIWDLTHTCTLPIPYNHCVASLACCFHKTPLVSIHFTGLMYDVTLLFSYFAYKRFQSSNNYSFTHRLPAFFVILSNKSATSSKCDAFRPEFQRREFIFITYQSDMIINNFIK